MDTDELTLVSSRNILVRIALCQDTSSVLCLKVSAAGSTALHPALLREAGNGAASTQTPCELTQGYIL